jgi:cell fate regulator YaaT (PSP1 superfamily)
MHLVSAEYTLDRSKLIFSYLAEERVDFRELLKILASYFHTRIELRQIGSRDKAKMIGGIGICGLPLCCSTFLNEFDNISINRAKNQLLTLNIPKLSGHCGKLICCLKYEDDAYTDLKKDFPKVGIRVKYDGEVYRIAAMNVLTRIIKLENHNGVHFLPLEEVNGLPRVSSETRSK